MQSIILSREAVRILSIAAALLVVVATTVAQEKTAPSLSVSVADSSLMAEPGRMPTPLRTLIEEAQRNNPQIAASLHAWQASRSVPQQVSAFPETQFSIQHFSVGSPRPFAGYSNSNFAYIGFGASQDIPYPGKRQLRGRAAEHAAEATQAQSDSVSRDVIESLKIVYFRLAYIQQTLGILQKDDALLAQMEEAAEARYRTGQGSQQDVLKAQLQRTKILQELAHHHQEEGQLEAQLKQLLGRPQESQDVVPETLRATPLAHTAGQLLQSAREQNPDIRSKAAAIQQQQSEVELAHKDFRPDFNVQYMYQHTAGEFRDYYMATFSLRLPNRGRQKAELSEAIENQERARQDMDAESQRVLSEVQQQYVRAKTSEEQLKIYRDGLVPQSEATFRSALSAYQSNRQDFESLLSAFLDMQNIDVEYQGEVAEHQSALAELQRLTGVDLP